MVRSMTLLAVVGAGCVAVAAALDTPTINGDTKTWIYSTAHSDEFSGSSLDTYKWKQSIGDWRGSPPGVFQDNNVGMQYGNLNLNTKYEKGFAPNGEADCNCGYSDITTPLVVSKTKLKYGFFEISAKMAKSQLLSAFWLQGNSGEINIFESVPYSVYSPNGVSNSNNYHCFNAVGTAAQTEDNSVMLPSFDPSLAFNTYGIDWSASGVKFYINGGLVRTLNTNQISTPGCLDQSMSVIFSMETMESEGVPSNFGTKTTELAYFRYYTQDTSSAASVSEAKVAPKSCESLGWTKVINGVCGESDKGLGANGATACKTQATYQTAESTCEAAGARLCTADEMSSKVTTGTGCNMDLTNVWTSSSCGNSAYKAANGGGNGAFECVGSTSYKAVRCCADSSSSSYSSVTAKPAAPAAAPAGAAKQKTCGELGWSAVVSGVCGESNKGFKNGGDRCFNAKKYAKALEKCVDIGARLCTEREITSGAGKQTGCDFDKAYVWSSTSCGQDQFWVVKGNANGKKICEAATSAYPVRCCSQVDLASSPSPVPSASAVSNPVVAQKSCASIGWSQKTVNNVCASSSSGLNPGVSSGDKCWSNKKWTGAATVCMKAGARLCSESEFDSGVATATGCSFDTRFVWTSTNCEGGKIAMKVKGGRETECIPTTDKRPVRCCTDTFVNAKRSATPQGGTGFYLAN